MSKSVIDDHFEPNQRLSRTTRFYGIKFIEGKANIDPHSPLGSFSIEGTLANPREYFREVYGPFLCMLLVTSALTFVSGAALSLAGYYVPPVSIKHYNSTLSLESESMDRAKVDQYTNTLHTLRIGGIILLGIGGISMAALILTPFICLRRSTYSPLHSANEMSASISPPLFTQRKITNSRAKSSLACEPNFSYSITKQHVQPRSHAKSHRGRTNNNEKRCSYDQGFLSPELNRGPIFVSDETTRLESSTRLNGTFRTRSSSCCTRLSPEVKHGYRKSSFNISDIVNLESKATIVKAGSFHSLR